MNTLLMTLHVMTCIALIVVVLLQRGKGSDIGAALGGGGGQTVFGARGAGNFLTRLTTGAAVVFMLTSLSLAYLGSQQSQLDLFEGETVEDDGLSLDEIIPGAAPDDAGALEEIEGAATGALEEVGDALEEIGDAAATGAANAVDAAQDAAAGAASAVGDAAGSAVDAVEGAAADAANAASDAASAAATAVDDAATSAADALEATVPAGERPAP